MKHPLLRLASMLVDFVDRKSFGERSDPAWRALARDLGTTYVRRWLEPPSLEGSVEGQRVRVEQVLHLEVGSSSIRTEVVVDFGLGAELEMRAENAWAELKNLISGEGAIKVGDPEFDRRVLVKGSEVSALAALDEPARRAVEALVDDGVALHTGTFRFSLPGPLVEASGPSGGAERSKLWELIQRTIRVGEQLRVPREQVAAKLGRNAFEDSVLEVRRRNLEALIEHEPHGATAQAVGRKALEDNDPQVRLLGARLLGNDLGAAELQALAVGDDFPPPIRVAALGELRRMGRFADLWAAAAVVLESEDPKLLRDALTEIALARASQEDSAREAIAQRAAGLATRPELADACAAALKAVGDARDQSLLLQLLETGNYATQIAAVGALARLGTAGAVEPLLERAKPLMMDAKLKEALQEAVRQIQGRLGPAEAGRLSLAAQPEQVGGLSLVENKRTR